MNAQTLSGVNPGGVSGAQEQAMRQQRRQMQKDAASSSADGGGGGGFTGPDQSGQWVSVGELQQGDSLDEALSGLSAGASSPLLCVHLR